MTKMTTLSRWGTVGTFAVGSLLQASFAEAPQDRAKTLIVSEGKASKVSTKDRVAKLGLLAKVSSEVSAVTSIIDGKRAWAELDESELGQVLFDVLKEGDLDLDSSDEEVVKIASLLFGEEFLLAVGEGSAKQTENLTSLSNLSNQYQIALMVQLLGGDFGEAEMGMLGMNPFGPLMSAFQENPDFLINLVASLDMPPVFLAARVSDKDGREEIAEGIDELVSEALGSAQDLDLSFVSDAEIDIGGVSLKGLQVQGKGLIEMLEEQMGLSEILLNVVGAAGAEDMMNSLKEKQLTLLGGVSGDVVYLYLGQDKKSIPLATSPEKSIAASSKLSFVDPYLDKGIVNVLWMEEELVKASAGGQDLLQSYIYGVRLGLKTTQAFGDTKKLEGLLTKVENLEKKVTSLSSYQAVSSVSYLNGKGLYSESFGGVIDKTVDWDATHKMGSGMKDSFITVQAVMDEAASAIGNDYLEAVFEAVYEGASLATEMDNEDVDMQDLKEGFLFFDKKLKSDSLDFWKTLRSADAGLGNEVVFEVDLAGTLPTIPEVPESVIEEGIAPRISMAMPVTDRAKLGESWKEMNASLTNILKVVGEEFGQKIPAQKPMSSKSDGLTTWFLPIPMQTDDFVPSVTIDDKVMVMSTSKEHAVALAGAEAPSEKVKGVVSVVNFAPLEKFLTEWLALIAKNPEEILVDEEALQFFQENEETLKKAAKSLKEFESWKVHTRMENGQLRTSSHFKTK